MNKKTISCCLMIILMLTTAVSVMAAENKQQPSTQPVVVDSSESVAQPPTRSPAAGEQIKWQVIGAGGNRGTSTNFVLTGTAGQIAVGKGTSANFRVNQGFWQNFGPNYLCGDVNANGIVNIADVVYLIQYIFGGGPAPVPLASGDVNCNGIVNIADVVYLIQYIFSSGPAPCDPDNNGVPDC